MSCAREARRAALVLIAALALAAACDRREPPAEARPSAETDEAKPGEKRPNLLLISVDTLRADHLGSYGYRLPTSPNLDRLASQGVRFADATASWPKTWPSMATLLTGKHPQTTGVRYKPQRPLPAVHETLAEVLGRAGYVTGAVVANANLARVFSFDQGFDRFVESWLAEFEKQTGSGKFENRAGLVKRYTNATIVTDQGIALLDELARDEPFFLWLHYIDPHGPYVPPPEYADLFRGEYPAEIVPEDDLPRYQRQKRGETGETIRNLSFYVAQYDREIRYFDDQLARLLADLERRGLRDDTLVVLTADHGESLVEDGYFLEHGRGPYQPTAHVPLIFVLPGRVPSGRVVEEPVGLIDVTPTLLDLLGVPHPEGVQGRSLAGAIAGDAKEGGTPAYVFMESGNRVPSQLVVRKGPWKLTRMRSDADRRYFDRDTVELYDLRTDPEEEKNVRDENPSVVAELLAELRRWQKETPQYQGTESLDAEKLDARTREQLEALGYLENEER
ncbi:MAG: DUF1501 domain-containing protein [Deltaproteobacteria bacterium]|nr:DUF1501 domain-containing protein [Deltaproteobacteria bacterium]